jgi:hypothetical protein
VPRPAAQALGLTGRVGRARRDDGGDGVTDTVTGGPGGGGAITALPIPVEPRVSAAFTACR